MWIRSQLYSRGLGETLCRIGQEAVWNWMLFLPSHHYSQPLTKAPNLPVPLNLCLKMKDMSNGGSFLILLFTERRRERKKQREKRSFRASFSLLLLPPWFSSGLEPLVGGKGKFLEKFLPPHPTINQCPHPLFFGREGERANEQERKKARGNMVKGGDEKKGTLETAVGEVS